MTRVATRRALLSRRDVPWWLTGGISPANVIAAYQPKGAGSLADSYINLANPGTYNAAPGTAPTFDTATGWTFNGTTQYLDSGITCPSAGTWSVFVQFAGCTGGAYRGLFGSARDTGSYNGFYLKARHTTTARQYVNDGQLTIAGGAVVAGNLGIVANQGYLDGTATGAAWADDALAMPTNSLLLGAYRLGVGISGYFIGNIIALSIYNTSVAAQASALSAAMAAL